MAKEDIQLKISAAVESAEAAKSLGQLRKSLMEIQSLQAEVGESSGAEFDKLSQAANAASAKLAETRDRICDIQDKNRTLEGTPIERLSGSFGLLKESIMNLDFDKAKIGAEGLLNTFTPVVDGKLVTGLAGVKGAFGMLGDGVKSLGNTFMTVGKALLTNPIFLLAAAIIAIVAVVIRIGAGEVNESAVLIYVLNVTSPPTPVFPILDFIWIISPVANVLAGIS